MTIGLTVDQTARVEYLRLLMTRPYDLDPWIPEPHQLAPDPMTFIWLLQAGRGSGKTAAASHYVQKHLNGPPCISDDLPHRVSLIAPTLGDAIESAHLTDMSLTRLEPGAKFTQSGGGSMVRWPNGSQVRLFGTYTNEDVERLRAGGNRCLVWGEELAAWRRLTEAWEHMMFGLRLGKDPHVVATTTPKPRPAYKELLEEYAEDLTVTKASTADNPYLNEAQKDRLYRVFDGTSLGKQELHGELVDEAEGAIWTYSLIEPQRFLEVPEVLGRTVVAIDPPGGRTEAGIVAAAALPDCDCGNGAVMPHFVVIEDRSAKLSPKAWAGRSIDLYTEWAADRIVAESNYGGDMVEATVRNIDPSVSFKMVHASRGKRLRAEPIKAIYEQKRVHHVRELPSLESEMVSWVPDESDWSPNRLDALVWALTELSGTKQREWGAA